MQTVAPPDGPCNVLWPRQGNLTGPLAAFAELCYTDDGSSMRLKNTSPFVLRVTNTGGSLTRWQVDRPYDGSWATLALNQTVPADYYYDDAALLVPGASLWAKGDAPVTINFTISSYESTVAYGSKVIARYLEGIANRAKSRIHPVAALMQQTAKCATAGFKVFDAYLAHNNQDIIIKLAEGILPCVTVIQQVRKLVDDAPTPPPAATAGELRQIARVAKTSLLEDGLRLGARVAVFVGSVR